ncbi:uncharacterized protein [Clytia hemisphaerica]|uniref:Uncharacterized protein n=1 Tax=Clytia hemisphaerica TaxID=252671 RepID=A0A7M5UKI7_9CNID
MADYESDEQQAGSSASQEVPPNNGNDTNDPNECFVHAVGPMIKPSTPGKSPYFNCVLQMREKSVKAVGFSPSKRSILEQVENSHTPVKLSRYDENKDTIVIKNNCKISLLDAKKLTFDVNPALKGNVFVTIKDLNKLATSQLVKVKASVVSCEESFDTKSYEGGRLMKQDINICDSTSFCRLTLYGDYVDQLKVGKSYEMNNLRLKIVQNRVFLNSTKNMPFIFAEIKPLENLVDVSKENFCVANITGSIRGVSEVNVKYLCSECNRDGRVEGIYFHCFAETCNLKILKNDANQRWYLKLLIVSKTQKEILFFPNDSVVKLAKTLNIELNNKEEVETALFSKRTSLINIEYNAQNNMVTNIL